MLKELSQKVKILLKENSRLKKGFGSTTKVVNVENCLKCERYEDLEAENHKLRTLLSEERSRIRVSSTDTRVVSEL